VSHGRPKHIREKEKIMRTSKLALVGLAVTVMSIGALLAQPSSGGPGGPGGATSRPMHHGDANAPGGGGFHLIPPFAAEKMNLTDDQKKQLEELAKETKSKLDKILTPEQQKILHEARPPHPMGGQGGGKGGAAGRPAAQ